MAPRPTPRPRRSTPTRPPFRQPVHCAVVTHISTVLWRQGDRPFDQDRHEPWPLYKVMIG